MALERERIGVDVVTTDITNPEDMLPIDVAETPEPITLDELAGDLTGDPFINGGVLNEWVEKHIRFYIHSARYNPKGKFGPQWVCRIQKADDISFDAQGNELSFWRMGFDAAEWRRELFERIRDSKRPLGPLVFKLIPTPNGNPATTFVDA